MPKVQQSTLSGLIDSDSDEDQFVMATPELQKARAPAKKARGKPKAAPTKPAPSKVTKTKAKAPSRRLSGRLVAQAKSNDTMPAKSKRSPLKDMTNQQNEAEEADDLDVTMDGTVEDFEEVKKTKPAKATKPKATRKTTAAGQKAVHATTRKAEVIAQETPEAPKPAPKATKKKAPKLADLIPSSPEQIVQETQYEKMDVDADMEEEMEEPVSEPAPKPARQVSRVQSHSRQRQPSTQRRRAGSASDTERSDPVLRRKLGEMTKKYETLNIKYQDLREVGLKQAERNFENLRKKSETERRLAGDLIESRTKEKEAQAALAKEVPGLKKKLDAKNAEIKSLQEQLKHINASLSEAQSENKTLSAKLAANRTAAASIESANARVPGSAVKANGGIRLMGTAEAAQVAQAAQLKEDIYRDLTGLIIRSVKRDAEEDLFDCIQTGRNGTLHFKLVAANEKSSESYEDAQCSYVPQLDPSRDRDLMELLPDYLVDEISFPRPHATKFYARVLRALTEKPAQD